METNGLRTIKKGLFKWKTIQYDANHLEYHAKKLQFPIKRFKWVGFIGEIDKNISFDPNTCYFAHYNNIFAKWFGKKTVYLSVDGMYDSLPTNDSEMAEDDKDDWTMTQAAINAEDNDEYDDDETNEVDEDEDDDEVKFIPMDEDNEDYDADLLMKTDTLPVKLSNSQAEDLLALLKASSAVACKQTRTLHWIIPDCLAYSEKWAIHVKPRIIRKIEVDSTPIEHMAFMVRSKGLLNQDIYCGYHRQISVKKVPVAAANEFYGWCKKRSARLNEKGEEFISSIWPHIFNPACWFFRERIVLTPKAIIYHSKKLRKDEMVYLPYKRTQLMLMGTGLFTRKLEIYGEQNILPRWSFCRSTVQQIHEIIASKNIESTSGRSYHSTYLFPSNWFGRGARVLTLEDRMIYYPGKYKNEIKDLNGQDKKTKAIVITYKDIVKIEWYKPFFNWLGTLAVTARVGKDNIRKDQLTDTVSIVIPQLLKFNYRYFFFCSGSLRGKLDDASCDQKRLRKAFEWSDYDPYDY